MDRHSSTIKRHRQSLKRRAHNRALRSKVKTFIKSVEEATTKDTAEAGLRSALQYIDKSAHKRVTHPNRAARLKSRLTRLVASRFAS
ncbi:MAG: 30S ribosomal protein S20 [Candidatus Marinimicrobia bacterium]|nr:30S ribosomal protein S20 [Candidatus Neomarinimicrobiota bacterium]